MELQDSKPSIPLDIERIGFIDVKRRLTLKTKRGVVLLNSDLSIFVDVSSERRGVHLSRNIEALLEVIDELESAETIEEYLDAIALKLMEKHEYIQRAVVKLRSVHYMDVDFHDIKGVEPIDIDIEVERSRSGDRLWRTGVGIRGITVCPSAKETTASMLNMDRSVAPSHMQRVVVWGWVVSRGRFIDVERIARALFRSVSAPTFTLLKRVHEANLVIYSHRKPMFIEDVVREAVVNIALELNEFDDGTFIEVEVLSLESIHPHNLYAYKKVSLGRVRELIEKQTH